MDIIKHEDLFSKLRMQKYILACNSDIYKALNLYKYNIQASQALYPIISILEIALRNCIDGALMKFYEDNNWLINKRNHFANNPLLIYTNKKGAKVQDYFFSDKLKKAEDKLKFRNIPLTHGKLLAELTFGFWVKFYNSNSIKILKGVPLNGFKNKPSMNVGSLNSHLNSIVNVRNRISHSEPICFNKKGQLCLISLKSYETDILEAIRWIDNDLYDWAKKINFFPLVYNRIVSL